MNTETIKALAKAIERIETAAAGWRIRVKIETFSKLEVEEVNTSIDAIEGFSAGSVSQVTRPVEYIRLGVSQSEADEFTFEAPFVPPIIIRYPSVAEIEFHVQAIIHSLGKGPGPEEWAAATKRSYKQSDLSQAF